MDTLDWLDTNGKNLIIVSGDYGMVLQRHLSMIKKQHCLYASGIYDRPEDSGILIEDTREGFTFQNSNYQIVKILNLSKIFFLKKLKNMKIIT